MLKCLFIILTISLIHTESYSEPDITITNNRQFQSEQAHLLKLLNEIPEELGITDAVHLEEIEGYINNAEKGYDSEIVVNFASTIGIASLSLVNYLEGAEAIQRLIDDFENSLTSMQQQRLLITMAELQFWAKRYQTAFDILDEILPQIEDHHLRGWAYSTIGSAVYRLGRFDNAIQYYLNAIEAFGAGDETFCHAEVYNRLGNIYYSLEEYDVSIKYYQRNLDMAIRAGDEVAMANGYLNIGAAYRQSGNYEKALQSYLAGIEQTEQLGNVREIARGKMNIANLYASMERFDKALENFRESLAISEEHGIEVGILMNHINIGRLLFDKNQYDESEEAYLAAFQLMNRESHIFELRHVSKQLAELYEAKGDYMQAFSYLQLFTELNGDIFDSEKLEIAEDLRTRYETELKEQDLAIAELTIGTKTLHNRILLVFILSLIIILYIGVSYFRKKNEHYRVLYNRNLEVLDLLEIDSEAVIKSQHNGSDKAGESEHLKELYQTIKPLFTEKKIYRDPNLNLSKVSKLVGSNRKYVSEAIKSSSNMQFNHYVNFYRVNEAKKMILNGEESMSEVQHTCGFNSRTTFYSAFKTFTGMSPSKFKEMSRYRVSG
ncbi:MAG: helix-turn-helix domain-containing protein [Balneolaceae bacterium]|nr:MAG: helix-turn-helix domain-containing protein [Balneolaceae bacterium]